MNKANLVLPQEGLKKKDKIDRLPGQPHVEFDQYGGYVTVNESAGRAFYYYFVEAENSKQSLPLLLWLNGGPGCSSLAYGAMQELGPFRVNSDGKTLYRNKFAWNQAANVLFVESPAGVGFSYSNSSSDYENCGDASTAADNYVFLLNWLERFPEYKGRDFYISGESYAGHYVPQLAHTILHYNKMAKKTLINLKGILVTLSPVSFFLELLVLFSISLLVPYVFFGKAYHCGFSKFNSFYEYLLGDLEFDGSIQIGNAVINDATDSIGMYDYLGSHAIVSDETIDQIRKHCDFSPNATTQSEECNNADNDANRDLENIDIYNIYAPLCLNENLTSKPKRMSPSTIDPCSEAYTYAYMNREDVQEALHANVTKLDHDWEPCSDIINTWGDSPVTIIPLLTEFMQNNLRVWIFSGDTDARVPVTSTQYSISSMKLPVKTPWHQWLIQGEVAGFAQVYEGELTFSTIRGAGHQVPSYKPKSALALVSHFLTGKPLNDSGQ